LSGVIEQIEVQVLAPNAVKVMPAALIVIGVILLVAYLSLYNRFKDLPVFGGKIVGVGIGVNSKYGLAILGISLILLGGFVYGTISAPSLSVVTIGDGYINVKSNSFAPTLGMFGASDNKNVTSEEIATAFVGQVGSGDFKLHKQYGTNFGDTNIGVYTLGNGAKAYMATTNSTNLIIELKNDEYLIIGTPDTQTLANSFAQNVHPLLLTPQQ
jgi:hypothetical protein